jgi:hypothetical protein
MSVEAMSVGAIDDFTTAQSLRGADMAELLVAKARAEESMASLDAGKGSLAS